MKLYKYRRVDVTHDNQSEQEKSSGTESVRLLHLRKYGFLHSAQRVLQGAGPKRAAGLTVERHKVLALS